MGFFKKVASAISGGVGGGVVDMADKVSGIVEKWIPGAGKKHEMNLDIQNLINDSVADARKYDPRTLGGGIVGELINLLVDGASRMIRPGVTIGLVGGIMGWWKLPATGTIDPVILGWIEMVLIFWFGGRALFKDLPSLIKYSKMVKKLKD